MKNRLPLLALLVALGAASCAQDRMSLEIQQLCYPPEDCTFSATCEMQYIGSYAVASGSDLRLYLQVANQMPNNADPEAGRVNSNDAHVTDVSLDLSGGVSGSGTISLYNNELVPADGTSVIGIWIPTAAAPAGSVVSAKIRLVGYYDNGREFQTGDFPLDIQVGAAGTIGTCPGTTLVSCPPLPATNVMVQRPSACAEP